MKTNWPIKKLGEVLEKNGVIPAKIKRDEYRQSGKYSVVDQGENLVAGYINDEQKLYRGDLPVIIFGDHTRILKYIDFPFAFGADGIKILRPQEILLPKFFYYTLILNPVANQGYKRHFSLLANIKILVPPLAIQRQIAERLDKIAEARKLNDNLIQKTDELFQSLLHKELNPIRDSKHSNRVNPAGPADAKAMAGKKDWEVKKLGDKNVLEIIDGDRGKNYPPKNEFQKSGYCLFLNTKNVTQAGFIFNETDFISKERDEKLRKGKLQRNDVVLTTRGTVGNSALYDDLVEFNHIRINSGMVVLRPNIKEVIPKFLSIVISSKPVLRQFKQILSGTAQPQLPITNLVKIKFPLPPIETQKQIVSKLSAVQDYKKQLLEQKAKLKELFDSALHKLMSTK